MSQLGFEKPLALMRAALSWWLGELQALLPASARRVVQRRRPRVTLVLDRDGAHVLADGLKQSETLPLDVAARIAVATANRFKSGVAIALPASAVFSRKVSVPPVGRAAIARILDLDMARATPFRPDEVYTTWWLETSAGAGGTRLAHHLISKRACVDAARDAVVAAGGSVAWIGAQDEGGQPGASIDFMREPEPGPLRFVLPVAAAVLLLAALVVADNRQSEALADIKAQTAVARTAAGAVRRSIDDAATIIEQSSALQRIRQRDGMALSILADLTAVLPDTAVLTELRLEGRNVEISGIAIQAAKLPQIMETSGRFTDVALVAPLTIEGRDRERFSIRASVRAQAMQ